MHEDCDQDRGECYVLRRTSANVLHQEFTSKPFIYEFVPFSLPLLFHFFNLDSDTVATKARSLCVILSHRVGADRTTSDPATFKV